MRDPFNGYDQWKTTSPYDGIPDDICYFCGVKLPGTLETDDDWVYEGFCSKECQDDCNNGKPDLICVRPMLNLLCDQLDPNPDLWGKRLYKGTNCGAWLQVVNEGEFSRGAPISIEMGSIVEGCDCEAEPQKLTWPFTKDQFWNAVQAIEDDCLRIWNETHGCEGCAKLYQYCGEWGEFKGCDGVTPVHPDCKECSGYGIVI